jgi:hypothetical protein
VGSAPYLGGGFGHFYAYAPVKIEYAIDRFAIEAKRQLDVLDRRLAETEYITGSFYTIADMAIFPWYGELAKGRLYGAASIIMSMSLVSLASLRATEPNSAACRTPRFRSSRSCARSIAMICSRSMSLPYSPILKYSFKS